MRILRGIAGFLGGGLLGIPISFFFQPAWAQRDGFGQYVEIHFKILGECLKNLDKMPELISRVSRVSSDPLMRALTGVTGNPLQVSLNTMLICAIIGGVIGLLYTGKQETPAPVAQPAATSDNAAMIICRSCGAISSADRRGFGCDNCGVLLLRTPSGEDEV